MMRDNKGKQASHMAAMRNHKKLLEFFFDHGVDMDAQCAIGKTPAHYAAQHGGTMLHIVISPYSSSSKS